MVDDRADAQTNGPGSQTNFGVVQERVKHFEEKLDDLVDSLKDTNKAVQKLAETVAESGKTKWEVLIAGGLLICAVIAGVWTVIWLGIVSPISDRAGKLEALAVTIVGQERLDIQHLEDELKTKADSAGIEKTIDKLDLAIHQLNKDLGFEGRKK